MNQRSLKEGFTALKYAVGDLDMTRYLVEHGANIHATDNYGSTALHNSIFYGFAPVEVVQYLIEKGADVNAKNIMGETPLHANPTLPIAKLLIDAGADVNALNNAFMAPIHSAVQGGNMPLVEILLKHGAHVNLKYGPDEQTPLLIGLSPDGLLNPEFIQFLVEHGADPTIQDRVGNDAYWYVDLIYDEYPRLSRQLGHAITEGLRRRGLRAKGRNLQSLMRIDKNKDLPQNIIERLMTTLTGVKTKDIARPNESGRIRNIGNIRETLKNIKRNYNRVG